MARAFYVQGAAAVDVRKADGTHKAPLTDRDKTEFASTWTKDYEDLDVTCYGLAKGAATVVTWADGTKEYGVTFQGLGGEELTFDSDEVADIVKGIKEADVKKEAEPAESSSAASAASEDSKFG